MPSSIPDLLLDSMWPGLIAWTLLSISYYALTIICASLYKKGVQATILFEGSYELTPAYQRDVDQLKRVSPRFVASLVASVIVIALAWRLVRASSPRLYSFMLGALLLQLTVHVRHIRNLSLFRAIAKGEGVRGRIEYSRRIALRMSVIELTSFAGMFFVMFAFTGSWFVLGGTIACLAIAQQHRELARKSAPDRYDSVSAPAS